MFVLTLAGDVLLEERRSIAGGELLDEARRRYAGRAPTRGSPFRCWSGWRADTGSADHDRAPSPALVEQLSEREMAVLRYLPSTLSLPEIARELYVSPNTVKTQCSSIYRKLAVTSRRAAVQAAREHRLL